MSLDLDLVVFDLSGTTVADGDAVNRCFRKTLQAAGMAITTAAADTVMGLPKPEALRILINAYGGSDGERLLANVDSLHADFVARMLRIYGEDPNLSEVEGTSEVFRTLRRSGVKVGVDTGFSREITDLVLDRMGWVREGLIDATVSSDQTPRGRPHPDMIQHLMLQLGVACAARVAKVGDTPADLGEGTNAGCGWVIGVTSGNHSRAQLEVHPHTHIVNSVAQLLTILPLT